jgi:protein-S-isoprenylcysteine O-methyltransferase Ste14
MEGVTMREIPSDAVGPGNRPPLIFGAILGAILLHKAFALPSPLPKAARILGFPLVLAGLLLGGSAFKAQRRVGTTPNPYQPTTVLVETGPYRFTRNPMYIGMALIAAGLAFLLNAFWALLLIPGMLFSVDRGMVSKEEQYLEARFGEDYQEYKSRVPRWV